MLEQAESNDEVRAVVITGNEQAFSAGQDLKEEEPPSYLDTINAVFGRLEALPKPTIAAINGWCIAGGLELALCCDLRVCGEAAKIGDWHARINSIGGAGATVRLVRTIGLTRAKELVFSARVVDAREAVELGLVQQIAEGEVLQEAIAFADRFQHAPTDAIGLAKSVMNRAFESDRRTVYAQEAAAQAMCRESEFHQEAVRRFLAKEPPVFQWPEERK